MKTLLARTLDEWRGWLTQHHASESEVWLIFHKQHTGEKSIDYKDALDEALCFGWVDSLVKRLDDRRFARKFTPRRADSRWSDVNRKRYAQLKAMGRLKPPGIARPPTKRGSAPRPARRELPSKLPEYIQAALKKHPKALRHFEALPPSHRRRYFAWIESAKREETKLRRLAEAIRLLTSGKELGLKQLAAQYPLAADGGRRDDEMVRAATFAWVANWFNAYIVKERPPADKEMGPMCFQPFLFRFVQWSDFSRARH